MVEAIKLIRFKQFQETEIRLRPFCLLMGENNSGKTTVLQAIWLALHSLHHGRLLTLDRRTLQAKVSSTGCYLNDVMFAPQEDLSGLFYNKIARGGQTYDEKSGAMLEITDERQNFLRLHLRDLFKNLNVKLLTPEEELYCPQLQNSEPLFLSGFQKIGFQEERMYPAGVEAKITAGEVHEVVRNTLLDLRRLSPEKYRYLERILEEEFGFWIRELHFQENEERYIVSEYEERDREDTVALELGSCGSGMMQILQLLAVILRYCPEKTGTVLIDEPELHLSESQQEKLLRILMQVQQHLGIQMILATQSAAMLRSARPEDVIPVMPQAAVNQSLAGETDVQNACGLDAYTLGKVKLSGRLVFLEDGCRALLEQAAAALPGTAGRLRAVPMLEGSTKEQLLPRSLRGLKKAALEALLRREIGLHAVLCAGGRSAQTCRQMEQWAAAQGIRLHVLRRYEMENYLLNAELLERALRSNPRNAGAVFPTREEMEMRIKEELCRTLHHSQPEQPGLEELLAAGAGYEALEAVLSWFSRDCGLAVTKRALLEQLQPGDLPEEFAKLLAALEPETAAYDSGREKRREIRPEQREPYEQLSFLDLQPQS